MHFLKIYSQIIFSEVSERISRSKSISFFTVNLHFALRNLSHSYLTLDYSKTNNFKQFAVLACELKKKKERERIEFVILVS